MPLSNLDMPQIINNVYDQTANRLRTDSAFSGDVTIAGDVQVEIDAADGDNIAIANADGSKKATISTVGLLQALDVNVANQIVVTPQGLSTDIRSMKITVTDIATAIPGVALLGRNSISIRIWGAATVFFGDSAVTVAQGYPKNQFEEIIIDAKDNPSVAIYGICNTGETCDVRVMELA